MLFISFSSPRITIVYKFRKHRPQLKIQIFICNYIFCVVMKLFFFVCINTMAKKVTSFNLINVDQTVEKSSKNTMWKPLSTILCMCLMLIRLKLLKGRNNDKLYANLHFFPLHKGFNSDFTANMSIEHAYRLLMCTQTHWINERIVVVFLFIIYSNYQVKITFVALVIHFNILSLLT